MIRSFLLFTKCIMIVGLMSACQSEAQRAAEAARKDSLLHCTNNIPAPFPFYSACDYKKWDTQAAKDYYVSSSPTIFLLDSNNKIILRPPTVASLDSWLN